MKRAVYWMIGCLILNGSLSGATGISALSTRSQSSPATEEMPATQGGQFYAMHAYLSVLTRRMAEERAREMNVDRQRRLEAETNRLVGLVNELTRDVRSDKEIAPLDLSRRAAEIEKLARSVQDRMKG